MVTLTHSSSILGILGTGRGHPVLARDPLKIFLPSPAWFGDDPGTLWPAKEQLDVSSLYRHQGPEHLFTACRWRALVQNGKSVWSLLWFTVTFVPILWGICHLLMRLFIVTRHRMLCRNPQCCTCGFFLMAIHLVVSAVWFTGWNLSFLCWFVMYF